MTEFIQARKYATIQAGTGDNTVVALVANQSILVLAYVISPAAAVVCKWQSNGVAELSNEVQFVGTVLAPFSSGYNPDGWFRTLPGEPLVLNLSGAVVTGVHVVYVEV